MTGRLAWTDHRRHLTALCAAAVQAVDPAAAVHRALARADFASARRVFVVGAGKAGLAMAQAVADLLGNRLTAGVMAVPQLPDHPVARLQFIQGGHPVPTEGSLAAGQAIATLLSQTTAADLVIALISGGGSALLEWLRPGLTLADLSATNTVLLKSGAAIHEINLVRQQLSQIKGGGLARLAQPARVLSLILSDVVGNPLNLIASGPTVPMVTPAQEAWAIIEKYQLARQLPGSVLTLLQTPLPASRPQPLGPVENRLIASNRRAGEAAAEAARSLGFAATYLADDWQGEARSVGHQLARLLLDAPEKNLCLIAGGETTVTVRGPGRGGRNQEVALAAALDLAGQAGRVVAAFGTDGLDGPTDAAGAVVTGATLARAQALGLDPQTYLDRNDAYPFFQALGDLIITGPTGTNVNDLLFGLAYEVC